MDTFKRNWRHALFVAGVSNDARWLDWVVLDGRSHHVGRHCYSGCFARFVRVRCIPIRSVLDSILEGLDWQDILAISQFATKR